MVMGLMRQAVESVVGAPLPWRVVVWVQATVLGVRNLPRRPSWPLLRGPSRFGAVYLSFGASVGGLPSDLADESLCRPLLCPCEWWWADVGCMVDGRRARDSLGVVGGTRLRKRAPYRRAW